MPRVECYDGPLAQGCYVEFESFALETQGQQCQWSTRKLDGVLRNTFLLMVPLKVQRAYGEFMDGRQNFELI